MGEALQHDEVRLTESAIPALATLPEMEWRTTVLSLLLRQQKQLDENTDITADTQEVLNRDVLARLDRMSAFLEPAESFFRVLGAIGNGVLRVGRGIVHVGDFLARVAVPVLWLVAVGGALWAWWKTGAFTWPKID